MSTAVDPTAPGAARAVPDGYVLHSESSTSILFALPTSTPSARKNESKGAETRAPVFLNPVQQFNRDISIVAIRAWSEIRQDEKRAQWTQGITKKLDKAKGMQATRAVEAVEAVEQQGASKRRKVDAEIESGGEALPTASADEVTATGAKVAAVETVEVDSVPNGLVQQLTKTLETPPTYTFTILEALSASGLRAIRYAKEIPLLRYVIANDLEPSAVESIRKNVEWNGLGPTASAPAPVEASTSDAIIENEPAAKGSLQTTLAREGALLGKVRPNEGDACGVMYSHRTPEKRFDCIDLDPYGSAVPFLDAAIGAVTDGGLLCITCTDLAVLAGHNYPEKCFSHYGGTSVNAEYSHEVALRLVLSTIAASAARYGRYIVPHLSLSIDFYVRVFVRVYTSPKEVKQLASNTALLFYCHDCQASYLQPFGRMSEKISKSGQTNVGYHVASGPPPEVGERCGECGGKFHVGGPLWAGPLHKKDFVAKMLQHVQSSREAYGTSTRIEGMLSVAHSEIAAPFYFTPGRLSGLFHCISPPIVTYASALLNAGYEVSRSHAAAGSLKTNASRSVVHDVMRAWIVENPVSMKNIKEGTPTARLLAKERTVIIDLSRNAGVETAIMSNIKVVRYQMNPTANWGPLKAAVQGGK